MGESDKSTIKHHKQEPRGHAVLSQQVTKFSLFFLFMSGRFTAAGLTAVFKKSAEEIIEKRYPAYKELKRLSVHLFRADEVANKVN